MVLTKQERESIKQKVKKGIHPYDLWKSEYKDKVTYNTVKSILSDAGIGFGHLKRKKDMEFENGESVDVSRTSKGLTADINVKTKSGESVSFQDILKNPKFKQVIDAGKIDLDNYYVDRFTTNSWDVTNAEGETYVNHQFKIWWKLKSPEPLEMALKGIEKNIGKLKRPRFKIQKREKGNHMVEVALYDIHLSMMAWREETGEDYDLYIAQKSYINAVEQLLDRISDMDVDYFLFPVGNDFFHINDLYNQTPTNRNPLDVDSRLAKIIEEGEYIFVHSVEKLKQKAPVEIFWIPGNHDPQTSFYLLRILNAWYQNDDRVQVDTSPKQRKYRLYGKNLIGFLHGCSLARSKHKQLPGIMADETAELGYWKPKQYREIHMGHMHTKNELIFNSASTYGSVVVRVIPSITGTDAWHFNKGFTKTSKTAQFFVWNKEYGLESVQDIHIPMNIYKDYKNERS